MNDKNNLEDGGQEGREWKIECILLKRSYSGWTSRNVKSLTLHKRSFSLFRNCFSAKTRTADAAVVRKKKSERERAYTHSCGTTRTHCTPIRLYASFMKTPRRNSTTGEKKIAARMLHWSLVHMVHLYFLFFLSCSFEERSKACIRRIGFFFLHKKKRGRESEKRSPPSLSTKNLYSPFSTPYLSLLVAFVHQLKSFHMKKAKERKAR